MLNEEGEGKWPRHYTLASSIPTVLFRTPNYFAFFMLVYLGVWHWHSKLLFLLQL
jgi:hypothetical protein